MQRITNLIKPSILRKGKYQTKLTDDDEHDEIPLKQSHHGVACRRGSFRLTSKDSSRSITSQDPTLQASISTLNSSISSIASAPYHYDDPLSGNESYSSLRHIEDLKPQHSRTVQDTEDPKPRHSRAVQGDEQVQLRKPRRLSPKRSPKPQAAAPSTNVLKTNPRRSRNVQAEQEVPRKIASKSLSTKRVPKVQQRSSSSRCITAGSSKVTVAPRRSTKTAACSLDDFMDQYNDIIDDFPDLRLQKHTDYSGSKSVTGW
jgi:hypothetical protein